MALGCCFRLRLVAFAVSSLTPPRPHPFTDSLVEVIFNVKDLRAMLSLCDAMGADVQLFFCSPGHPLVAEACFRGQVRCR